MISPMDLLLFTAAGALGGATVFFLSGIYLTVSSFRRRAVWKDHAGPVGKARTIAGHTYRNAQWRYAPTVAARGAALGGTLALLLLLIGVGAWEVFVSG